MVQWLKKNLISFFQLLCINRKHNFLICKDPLTNGRKSSNLVKSDEVICHFIRLYLVLLPPYSRVKFEKVIKILCENWTAHQNFSCEEKLIQLFSWSKTLSQLCWKNGESWEMEMIFRGILLSISWKSLSKELAQHWNTKKLDTWQTNAVKDLNI